MVVTGKPLQQWLQPDALGFEDALRQAVAHEAAPKPQLARLSTHRRQARVASTVRSVQRLARPPGVGARWIAEEYIRWLPTMPLPALRCEREGSVVRFCLGPFSKPLLVLRLSEQRNAPGRAPFYIHGGGLARTDGPRRGRIWVRITPE